ncbi:MAG: O-methyltransferase [Bacteroidales bacterium]
MDPITQYIVAHTTAEDPILEGLWRETHLRVMYPRMLSGHIQGKLLEMISYMVRPLNILEIGTYTGYSALCLAKGLQEGGKLHTIEVNPELTTFSGKYFKKAGMMDKIVQHTGDALEIIPGMEMYFDLVFIDAAKEDYLRYYSLVFDKVLSGSFIMADNALWDGKVTGKGKPDSETRGIIAFNDFVMNDPRVDNLLLQVRDGIMLIRKK